MRIESKYQRFEGYHLGANDDRKRGGRGSCEDGGVLVAQVLDQLCPVRVISSKDREFFCGYWVDFLGGFVNPAEAGTSPG